MKVKIIAYQLFGLELQTYVLAPEESIKITHVNL